MYSHCAICDKSVWEFHACLNVGMHVSVPKIWKCVMYDTKFSGVLNICINSRGGTQGGMIRQISMVITFLIMVRFWWFKNWQTAGNLLYAIALVYLMYNSGLKGDFAFFHPMVLSPTQSNTSNTINHICLLVSIGATSCTMLQSKLSESSHVIASQSK